MHNAKSPASILPNYISFRIHRPVRKKILLGIVSSLKNNIDTLGMVFCLHLGENVLIMLEDICHRNKRYYSH